MQINLNLTEKEVQVVELMAPGKSAEEIINIVIRDWFTNNSQRMYKEIKPQEEMLDEIIAVKQSTGVSVKSEVKSN